MASSKVTLCFGLILAFVSLTTSTSPATVNLGNSSAYVILAKTGITTTGTTAILGDLGISPQPATAMTGFSLTLSGDQTYSTSPLVTGKVYASNYNTPTPDNLNNAILDMQAAYNDAAGRLNPNFLALGGSALNGNNLTTGLYRWNTGLTIGGSVTIFGSATDIFIFQISNTLTFNSGAQILLGGGALAQNVFWQVAEQITFGSTSTGQGNFLGNTGIVFNSGASLSNGRALAQTAVTMIANAINQP